MEGRKWGQVLLVAVMLTACGSESGGGDPSQDTSEEVPAESAVDTAGKAACTLFRELASDAFGEVISANQVEAGLREVGDLAAEATTSAIRDNGVRVGDEANARSMISGAPNAAQDALAEACNSTFPI